ncbi:MAG TPA: cobalamin-binding protein [Planctomycetes bacterium]|nr:cobalamin-binding protein [Planctomycetota bacterium]HIL38112.1 cobalamin-binding protein [Planctomycetota bacterium]
MLASLRLRVDPVTTRIASLLPSATEILCALGVREQLVGRSHECDFPSDVTAVRTLTRSRVKVEAVSGDIDLDVRRILREVLAIYEVDVDALKDVAPSVVVTQNLCDVCAVSLSDVELALKEIASEAQVVSLSPTRLSDVWDDVRRVGSLLGLERVAGRVVADLEARLDLVHSRAATADARPSVLTIEWLDPVMIGGMWMPELVELAGGVPLVTAAGDHAPTLDEDALRELVPDVVLIKPCGFNLARTRAEASALCALLDRLGWKAWQEGRVFLADGNAFFNRPGPRLAESLEIMAACVHPELFVDMAEVHSSDYERLQP